ncbi:MAG: hypothetical protein FJY74_01950 [Candidatus Eisenbacteria bacterium]|nr:hypothetical protein [Candidatus Eisenbacteria bacterium]
MPRVPPASTQVRVLRTILGLAYLACAGMIVYALVRFVDLILPRYGNRFSYMFLLLGAMACWMAFRGLRHLLGRDDGRGRRA